MSEFRKYDTEKPRCDLWQFRALLEVAKVSTGGALKYSDPVTGEPGDNNWKQCGSHKRYIAAALRHISSHMLGDQIDPDFGLSHLAHATWSLMSALELYLEGK